MRHIPALLALVTVTACSPAPPKESVTHESRQASVVVPAAISSGDGACLSEIGKAASDRLVERCLMVSPATHPPCNAANSCRMIQDEIDRSCAMYGPDEKKPAECAA